MNNFNSLTPDLCKGLAPRMFAVNHREGETLSRGILQMLDPIENRFVYPCYEKKVATPLHFHDNDEYWGWVKGKTIVTIRLPDGCSDEFEIGPGWIVYCIRGVEHGHIPLVGG